MSAFAKSVKVDVLVIGGGTSGVTAGIQSARMGMKTLIVEETPWLGGMLTSAGVSAVDGNYRLRSGLWGEFLDSLVCRYGSEETLKSGWVSNVLFEPKVGNSIFQNMVRALPSLTVWQESSLSVLNRKHGLWHACIKQIGGVERNVTARIVIDATELGDVAAMMGVPFDIGMDGNGIIQDMTYTATLKDYGKNMMPSTPPTDYDPQEFACCCKNPLCVNPKEPDRIWSPEMMLSYGKLPNGMMMLNWPIEGNDIYLNIINMNQRERQQALQKAKARTLRFIYFIQKELGYNTLALADDEYPSVDNLPLIPYHREARRIHGLVRFTLDALSHPYEQPDALYKAGIAVGDYPVDHHHTRYDGEESLPDLHFGKVPSFTVPLATIIPQNQDGLIVAEKSISVDNLANGATRLQPVVMQIGQAAGVLAALAIKSHRQPTDVNVRDVQDVLLDAGGYIMPLLDVDKSDPRFKVFQRIAATGILKAELRSIDWKNEMWLNIDSPLTEEDIRYIERIYPDFFNTERPKTMTRGKTAQLLDSLYDPFHNLPITQN